MSQLNARQVRGLGEFGCDGSVMSDNGEDSDGSNESHSSESTADWLISDSLSEDEGKRRPRRPSCRWNRLTGRDDP